MDISSDSTTKLAQTIASIGQSGFEQNLFNWLHTVSPFDNLLITAFQDSAPPQALFRQASDPEVYAELETVYMSGAYLLDPYYALVLKKVPTDAYRLRDISPDAFHRSRYFHAYYARTTLIDEIAFFAYPARGYALNICLGRDAVSGKPFSKTQCMALKAMAPVVAALSDRHWAGLATETATPIDTTQQLAKTMKETHGIRLSPRQTEVALLILRGHSSISIGLSLGISVQTVKVFRRQLYHRCGISSQAELFALMLPLLSRLPNH